MLIYDACLLLQMKFNQKVLKDFVANQADENDSNQF